MVSAQVVGNQMVPPCEEWWFEMATKQHLNYYPSISPCSGYTAWMPDERFQENHNSFPLENWRRPMGRPCITWMKTIQHYLKSNLPMNEAINVAQRGDHYTVSGKMHSI